MEKISGLVKQFSEEEIRNSLKSADSVLVVGYCGLSGSDSNVLRQTLKTMKSRLFIVKNSITQRVFKDSGISDFSEMLQGPCGLVFVEDDLIATAKILSNFAKDHEKFIIEGGVIKDRILNKSDIAYLAKLASKKSLYTQLVISAKSPISGLVYTLNNLLNKFVIVLEEIKKKK